MFANAFRRQARAALVAAATRSLAAPALPTTRPRILLPLRTLSTSLARQFSATTEGPKTSENPPSLQLFLGNIAFEATEHDIGQTLSQFGEVESVRIVTNPDGSSRGFGYATFKNQEAATAAFEAGLWILDRPLRTDYTIPRDAQRSPSPRAFRSSSSDAAPRAAAPPSNVIFCGNLPFGADEAEVREKFAPFGAIRSVRVSTRPDGTSRGFAHVEFLSKEDAVAAHASYLEEPLYMLDRNVRVDFAPVRPTAHNPPSSKLYFYDYRGNEESIREVLKD
ncbi:hypothetical protein FB45DRAFT_464152 [Roridomyces roridus]|nr:hypothetical protein FB45DRAFT_464152 [Roridomyces roridus]